MFGKFGNIPITNYGKLNLDNVEAELLINEWAMHIISNSEHYGDSSTGS